MHGWMDGRMDGRMDVHMHVHVCWRVWACRRGLQVGSDRAGQCISVAVRGGTFNATDAVRVATKVRVREYE